MNKINKYQTIVILLAVIIGLLLGHIDLVKNHASMLIVPLLMVMLFGLFLSMDLGELRRSFLHLGLLLPIYLYFSPVDSIIPNWKDTFYLFLLALFCTVAVYVIFTEILKKMSPFTVNLSLNLEPIYAILIAFLFFNEGKTVNFAFYIGLIFVMGSVVLQTLFSVRKSRSLTLLE